jgi:SH3-like domain-containing protein
MYDDNDEREDGKSEIWIIEKRMIATPGYNLPDRETLNRMFAIITMDTDIIRRTNNTDYLDWWYDQGGLPYETVKEGKWRTIQDIAEDDQDYATLISLYQNILQKR